jgi:hypothetical protein
MGITMVSLGLRTYFMPICGSEPSALNHQIDGKALKKFQPNKSGNTSCGTGNDSWYGKIEIYVRKEMGNPQPSSILIYNYYGVQFID